MDESSHISPIVHRWAAQNSPTQLVTLEAMRGPLASLAGGVINRKLLTELDNKRAEVMDRRAFAVLVVGVTWEGAASVDVAMLDVGAAGEQPNQLPAVLSLGRHERCDFPGITGAALRHAMLMAFPPAAGEPARMEVVDLASGIGLGVGLGRGATKLLGQGRMRFGVGDFSVLAFLAEPGESFFPEGVDEALVGLDRGAKDAGLHLELAADEREEEPPTRALKQLGLAHMWSERSQVSVGTQISPVGSESYVIEATPQELQEGVLLGRYPRCRGSLELGGDGCVSRVHALLLSRRGQTLLIDCGSTNGTCLRPKNGHHIDLDKGSRVWPIDPGDDIRFNKVRLHFTVVDGRVES